MKFKIYYHLKNKFPAYFSKLTLKKIVITLIIVFLVIFIGTKSLLYIEKRNWDNRVGELYYSLNFSTYIPNLTDILTFWRYFYPSDLPKYEIKISKQNLKKLEEALPQEFFGSLPNQSVWVPAEFYADGEQYNIEIKNRGRMSRHWKYRKKSWHVKFVDEYWQGYNEINFILPEEKDFLVEDYGYYVARKLGLVTPNTWFARIKINNQPRGVYWVIEHWNEDFLERHQLSSGANLYCEDESQGLIYETSMASRKYISESQSLKSNYADLDILINCLNNCDDEEFLTTAEKIIDIDNFLAWQVHTAILGDDHQGRGHNIRLYFNSNKGKFQFFPVDVNQFKFDGQLDIHYNPLVSRLLSMPEIMGQRNQILWDYVNDEQKIKDDLKYYQDLYQQTKSAFYKDRIKRYSNLYFNYRVKDRYQKAEKQYAYIKNLLNAKTVEEEIKQVQIKFYNFQDNIANFEIITSLFTDILLTKIEHQQDNLNNFKLYYDNNHNNIYDSQDLYLTKFIYDQDKEKSYTKDFSQLLFAQREIPANYEDLIKVLPMSHRFFIVADADVNLTNAKFKFDLVNALSKEKIKEKIKFYDYNIFAHLNEMDMSIDDFVKQNPIFVKTDQSAITLFAGDYYINQDLIIPQNLILTIKPGAKIYLASKVSIISYSPIIAKGAKNNLISFNSSANKSWGVLAVIDVDDKSEFEYSNFNHGQDAFINGVYFSGMLSAYYADAHIKNCEFKNAQADDGVNIKYGHVLVMHSTFDSNSSDALDLDFCTGQVSNNFFIDNGNDALDISGSKLTIIDNSIQGSEDKGISIGEKSEPVIVNNLIINNKIGIEVKDLSKAIIINNTIADNEIGINEYQKKEIFGPGQAEVYNSIIWNNGQQITLDNVSEIQVSHSLVQGGWNGDDIIDTDPEFDNDYKINNQEINKVLNQDILKEYELEKYSNLGNN